MKTFASFAYSLLALTLAGASAACTGDAAAETSSDTSAIVAPPENLELFSDDATGAARVLLKLAAQATTDLKDESSLAYANLALSKIQSVHVVDRPNGRTFYLDGYMPLEDTVREMHFLIDESWASKWGAAYFAKLTSEPAPTTSRALSESDMRVVSALVTMFTDRFWEQETPSAAALTSFAKSDVLLDTVSILERPDGTAKLTFNGSIMEGGDMILGSATMTAERKVTPFITYDLTTTRETY